MIVGLLFSCGKSNDNLPPIDEPEEKISVKVMTYNIYGARSGGIPDLEPIAEVIRRVNPDLVALQEVDKFTNRNQKHGDIARKLGELTGMDYFFAKAMDYNGGEYGDAVLSKLPVLEKSAFNLEVEPALGGERRSVARIKVTKEDNVFYFVSTHFDHLSDERNRIKQANDFVELAKDFEWPVIVAGDLNATPESKTIRILKDYFSMGCPNGNCTQYTFSTSNASKTIDYILYAPLNAFTPKIYSVYTWANQESDHFPVVGIFEIN